MLRHYFTILTIVVVSLSLSACSKTDAPSNASVSNHAADTVRGSPDHPLRVMLVPADGGTEDGTRSDFEPVFNAITRKDGLHFEIRVGQSYSSVVEAMINGQVDIAFFGAVTYTLAKQAGAAELLAVAELNGESVYYSGIFVRAESQIEAVRDLRGKSVAFGDLNSTSSFNFPLAMLIESGLDPIRDLQSVYLTGTHANSLQALAAEKTDAACASFTSFEKAVQAGKLDPQQIRPLAKSDPIPYPPLAMHVSLPRKVKQQLRDSFNKVHLVEGISADQIRGYGGKRVDRYNADFSAAEFDLAMNKLIRVTKELKEAILKKAATRNVP